MAIQIINTGSDLLGLPYGLVVNPDGSINIGSQPPVSVAVGSESYIKGGSILTYSGTNYVDVPNRVAGSIVNIPIGSNFILSSPGSIGIYGGVNATSVSGTSFVNVIQTTNPWITLGSSYLVSSPGSVGVYGSLTTTGGSETYIKGGSILTYSGTNYIDVVNRVAGSIVNMPIVGVSGTLFAISGIVNQGTTPWIVSGTATIDNRVAGSIVNLPVGSNFTLSSPGSIGAFVTNQYLGSETYVKAGSIRLSCITYFNYILIFSRTMICHQSDPVS